MIQETLKGFIIEQRYSCMSMKEMIGGSSLLKKKGSVVVTYSRCRVCELQYIWFLEGIFNRDEASNDIVGHYECAQCG